MKRATRLAVVLSALSAVSAIASGSALAQVQASMNFEGLPEGMIVTKLESGAGIWGDAVPGSVAVFGDRAPVGEGRRSTAIVYDSTCGGGGPASCRGGEDDKFKPMLGKVLTIGKSMVDANGDGLVDEPDTSGAGGDLRFDFSSFGTGTVTVRSLDVLDAERGGWIRLYARGALVASVRFGPTLNNGLATVAIGHSGVDRMEVSLHDSGVIDNVRLAFSPRALPPAADCGSLAVSARSLAGGRRSIVWSWVRDSRGVSMAGVRVVARGAGVRTSRVTNGRGWARLVVRPRRTGVVRFTVAGGAHCARRVVVRGVRTIVKPPTPALTG
jgi:hypothetical protein